MLHLGAQLICAHAGPATPTAPVPRVTLGGNAAVTMASPWLVSGCALTPTGAPFCVSATFVTAATRVMVEGQPALLLDSVAVCAPTGTPLQVLASQTRVVAR